MLSLYTPGCLLQINKGHNLRVARDLNSVRQGIPLDYATIKNDLVLVLYNAKSYFGEKTTKIFVAGELWEAFDVDLRLFTTCLF